MSVFDLIILVVLVALILRGMMKGMVSQIVSVGSLFVCWIVASRFAFVIAPSIPAEEPWNKIGAMIVLFAVTMIAIRFAHGFLEKKLKDWHLAGLNKYLGGGLGFVKGLLICMVLTFFGVMLSEATREMVFQSKSGHHLARLIARTGAFIPSDSCEMLRTQIEQFNAKVDGTSVPENGSDEDYLKQLLAVQGEATDGTESSNGGTKIGELLSRSSAVLDEVQNLRDDFRQETSGAASLLDAIGRWWSGSDKGTDQVTEKEEEATPSENRSLSIGTVSAPETPKLVTPPAVSETPAISAGPLKEEQKTILSSVPAAPVQQEPVQREETLFRTVQSYSPPTAEELSALLPAGSTARVQPAVGSAHDPITSGAMAIPRSTFRLSAPGEVRSSDQLLHSSPSNRAGTPATLFTPRP